MPAELLISIFGWLEAADIMALRVTSALLHRLTFDDAALWRPLYLKAFGRSRPCKPASHTPESSNAELWQDYHLHIPQAKVVDTLIRRFQQTWEWAYKVHTPIHCTDAWSAVRLRLVCNAPPPFFIALEQGVGLGGAHAQRGNVLRHAQGEVPARALGGAPG